MRYVNTGTTVGASSVVTITIRRRFLLSDHPRRCVVTIRNKLLCPIVYRRTENELLTCLFQISDETNVLQDGTLIDLCGATLLWRSHEGLEKSPVSWIYVRGIQILRFEPVLIRMLLNTDGVYISIKNVSADIFSTLF